MVNTGVLTVPDTPDSARLKVWNVPRVLRKVRVKVQLVVLQPRLVMLARLSAETSPPNAGFAAV